MPLQQLAIGALLLYGKSDGLQVVRVETARGPVVLASDAAHYYANLQKRSPFPIVYNVGDMVQGWEIVERLAGHPDRFIPGHDPIVSEIYPRASDKVDAFALHLPPSRSFTPMTSTMPCWAAVFANCSVMGPGTSTAKS